MKRDALYMRISTVDEHPETQLHELRQFAARPAETISRLRMEVLETACRPCRWR